MRRFARSILTVLGLVALSSTAVFANSVTEAKAVYPSPQQAAKYNDLIWITAQVEPFAADSVYCDASAFAGASKTKVKMYDDGQHRDKAVGDGIFGTDTLRVGDDSTNAVYRTVRVYAVWGATKLNCPGLVGIKNRKPFLTPQGAVYPVGQSAAKDSDFVHIKSWVSDVAGKIDLLEVIDVSASLTQTDLDSIKVAAKAIVTGLDTTDAAGLWAFSSDIYRKVWRPLTGAAGHQTVRDSIDALEIILMTALWDATYMGSDSIYRFSKDIPVMVLLSDGANTVG